MGRVKEKINSGNGLTDLEYLKSSFSSAFAIIASFSKGVATYGSVIATFSAALLYPIGRIYRAEFLARFGVSTELIDASVYSTLTDGVSVLSRLVAFVVELMTFVWRSKWPFLLGVAIVAFILILFWTLRRPGRKNGTELIDRTFNWLQNYILLNSVIICTLSLTLSVKSSRVLGVKDANTLYCDPMVKVALSFKIEVQPSVDAQLLRLNRSGALRLLAETKDVVVVFAKPDSRIISVQNSFVVPLVNLSARYSERIPRTTNKPNTCQAAADIRSGQEKGNQSRKY